MLNVSALMGNEEKWSENVTGEKVYNYPTGSKNSGNYLIPKSKIFFFLISRRGPILWNTVLDAFRH